MSRLYMIEVHAKAPKGESETIFSALEHWGMSISTAYNKENPSKSYDNEGYIMFDGEITLCGGKDEHEAHLELKEILPNFPLVTKWNCVEFFEWDEVIRDEEEGGG